MAGYDGFSMSNNARRAYDRGEAPASKIAQRIGRGATAKGVRAVLRPSSWHHTSKEFNRTDFFDIGSAAENLADECGAQDAAAVARAIQWIEAAIIGASKAAAADTTAENETISNATVRWLEWGGTRKHPVAVVHEAHGCSVQARGDWRIVTLPDGKVFRKNVNTRGFEVA